MAIVTIPRPATWPDALQAAIKLMELPALIAAHPNAEIVALDHEGSMLDSVEVRHVRFTGGSVLQNLLMVAGARDFLLETNCDSIELFSYESEC